MVEKKSRKNNVTMALNVLYANKKEIYPAYVSKHNLNHENQVIFLMISNGEKLWHYLAVKRLSTLWRGITSEHHGDFYCSNCFYVFATESKLQSHKR